MHDVLNSTCCHSVTQTSPTLCNPVDCSTPGFLVLHHLSEFDQTHVCWNDRAIQPSHPLSSPSSPAFKLSQHRGLFAESTLLTEAEYIKKRWQEYTEKLYQKKKKLNDINTTMCKKYGNLQILFWWCCCHSLRVGMTPSTANVGYLKLVSE